MPSKSNTIRRLGASAAVAALSVASPALHAQETESNTPSSPDLRDFRQPPHASRPDTLYFLMNGNVTQEGIDADLEAMRDAGLGGLLVFDGSDDIPKGPVDYLSPHWLNLMTHMMQKADDLGLRMGMQNAPGWSSSGGPWIDPARSMQQLVWTEATIDGGKRVRITLPRPYAKRDYYEDAAVIAFPASDGDESFYRDQIQEMRVGGTKIASGKLIDRDLHSSVEAGPDAPLLITMRQAFPARAATLYAEKEAPAFSATIEASDNGESWRRVTTISVGVERGIESPGTANFDESSARYFRITPDRKVKLAEALLYATPRIPAWDVKTEQDFDAGTGDEHHPRDTMARYAIDPDAVIDISDKVDAQGRIDWRAPAGRWTILRLGHTTTGKVNVAASDSGRGLEVDKFDADAVNYQFDQSVAKVVKAAGPLAGGAFDTLEIDSYEAGLQNWTRELPADFAKRNDYAMTKWLPALTGRIVGDVARSDRFLFDFRRTLAELMADNYYGQMERRANAAGLRFMTEAYGPGPFDELQVAGRAQIPMTEFWTRTPWTDNRTVKMVASAAHVYGKNLITAEAFTGEAQTSRWSDYPYALKTLGDLMFAKGFNQIYFHRFAHQPNPNVVPGMTMGPWGLNMDRTNTWFAKSKPWLDTLARSQYMLQQGRYVADVLYFVGENSPNQAEYVRPDVSPDTSPLLATYIEPRMPRGYQYDLVNAEVLLKRARIEDGRIVLPNGASYRMLVLPEKLESMTPELAEHLAEMVEKGMVLLGPKPTHQPTLRGGAQADAVFTRATKTLWGSGTQAKRSVGRGSVYTGSDISAVLSDIGAQPDAICNTASPDGKAVWLHRTLSDGDSYFVANRQRRGERITCDFRVSGKAPELWNPETGETSTPAVYESDAGRTRVSFTLSPAGSTFVTFRKPAGKHVEWATLDGQRFIDAKATAPARVSAPSDSFTLSLWAKPDIDLRVMPRESTSGHINETGKNYLIPARSGRDMHGEGTAVAGLAVGRNGAMVIERVSPDIVPAVLVSHQPISGWTHFALVYDHGTPTLYINGKLAKIGLKSGRKVFAGSSDAPSSSGFTYFFEGNNTPLRTDDRALNADEIAALAAKPPPAPPISAAPATLSIAPNGDLKALAWKSGTYRLSDGSSFVADVPVPQTVTGPWRVDFERDRGAPDTATLSKLESLSHNDDPDIRYFAGTATYHHNIDVPAAALKSGHRIYLDLGRVEVLAEVTVNGKDLGQVWKEPYRIDVTHAVHAGANNVSVAVTTLWPNRMIGDAQKPDPNADRYVDAEWPVGETFDAEGNKTGDVMARKITELPEWYREGKPKPDDGRVTFTPWKFFSADDPLLDSGLLGPVRLIFAQEKTPS
ncbi:alpha-L-arabinofuranosidase [Stakelama sp. CBK3Z-3]|uniref:Alpha-L-arabinofuranosidase n=1 Tax=Stakelama flava TaxID=2860338 RepID=A0ABS6XNQ7_9SPHN|nr:glycosyl hydrolase [Stakelama flava]MBW4331776.1 alpha-L-arabinofuranosidase [Stakelama flava]